MTRRIVLCDGLELARLWSQIGPGEKEELVWVPREDEARARPRGFRALGGRLSEEGIAKLDPKDGDEFALVSEEPAFVRTAAKALERVAPAAPVLVMSDRIDAADLPQHPCLRRTGLRSQIRDDIDREFSHLGNLSRVVALRKLLEPRERVGILLQPDPDPDGIASALALRALLGRKRSTAPFISFGEVERPENRALVEALGTQIRTLTPEELDEFDGLALVDVQPSVFGDDPPARVRSVDVVVDHHPERTGYEAVIRDIRTPYGATSTIMTEYLRAAEIEPGPKLATALLYGIKSDTQVLGRETSSHDVEAFAFLHAFHSPALLRRVERPALPLPGLKALGRALARSRVSEGVHIVVLGRVREDVIPQAAEFALQAEGAEWAVAAGIVDGNLVFSVRNVGYVRAAGEVVRAVVEGLGVGGGHRTMAKGIIPVKAFRQVYGKADQKHVHDALEHAFLQAIRGEGKT
jgi:nanoRNase/pAp phosphatase (c-di-AMP/oligoRNAs hydrolase)